MLKPILFVPCEKVIISEENISSLISVLEHVFVAGEATGEIPDNAALPMQWSVLVLWQRDELVQEPITVEARIDLVSPKKEPVLGATHTFIVSNDYLNFRNKLDFPIFPIGLEGIYTLYLACRKKGDKEWIKVGEYPIDVIYQIMQADKKSQKLANNEPAKKPLKQATKRKTIK